jgi:hypothetical protein
MEVYGPLYTKVGSRKTPTNYVLWSFLDILQLRFRISSQLQFLYGAYKDAPCRIKGFRKMIHYIPENCNIVFGAFGASYNLSVF